MRQDKLVADGLITHRFPLSQWHQAVNTALDKGNGTIKVVFDYALED
jgi:threonine dehydrogenase-like Zn-dependent dehydrogenase